MSANNKRLELERGCSVRYLFLLECTGCRCLKRSPEPLVSAHYSRRFCVSMLTVIADDFFKHQRISARMEPAMSITEWFYQGEDGKIYGPASSEDMMCWYRVGYFDHHVLLRTDKDLRFFPLSEWINVCGQVPFLLPIKSMEAVVMQRMSTMYSAAISPHGQTCMSPVVLIPQNGMVRQQQLPPGLQLHIAPNGQQFPQALSSEPTDDGGQSTTSQTPDSDNWQAPDSTRRASENTTMFDKHNDTSDAPWLLHCSKDVGVQAALVSLQTVSVQTDPIQISASEASEALARLFGARVTIT